MSDLRMETTLRSKERTAHLTGSQEARQERALRQDGKPRKQETRKARRALEAGP